MRRLPTALGALSLGACLFLAGCASAAPTGAPGGGGGTTGGASTVPGSSIGPEVSSPPTSAIGSAASMSGSLAGPGSASAGGPILTPAEALARWAGFPVTATPRPLVLTGPTVLGPVGGFSSDAAKLAFLTGSFQLATTLPAAGPAAGGYPIVTAAAALDRLRAAQSNSSTGPNEPPPPPLAVVAVALADHSFSTDRGLLILPSWRFTLAGVADPVDVLAASASWAPAGGGTGSESAAPQDAAHRSPDGRTVTFSFAGAPAGPAPCGGDYAPDVLESATAVVVGVRAVMRTPAGSRDESVACPALAQLRSMDARLAAPLGNRVLLDQMGHPLMVVAR